MSDNADWNSNAGLAFGSYTPQDEFLHGRTGLAGDSLTETWYWGFNVPEAAINCFAYCWVHPNLDVVSAGLFVYQGIKRQHLACELFDMPAFMNAALIGDGRDIHTPHGFRVQVIEPMRSMRMTYSDPARDTEVDVLLDAVTPAMMRANNKHFEQVMRTTGTLRLRGADYKVDSFNVRDRSWGELRPEGNNPVPPYTWVTGVVDEDFAFNLGAHDDPARNPEWLGAFEVEPGKLVKDSWIWRDGRQLRAVKASKITRRDPGTLRPVRHEIDLEDGEGRAYRITGDIVASTQWSGWPNATCHVALTRWSVDGRTGWGESQEVQWNDYVWKFGQAS